MLHHLVLHRCFLSVQCNVQHWTEYKITLASVRWSSGVCPSVRPVSIHVAIMAKIVTSSLDRSSPNLEHSFSLTSRRKYFVSSPEMGVARVTWPLKFWALNANSSKTLKLQTSNLTCMFPGTVRTWPLKNFSKRGVARSRDPLNFWSRELTTPT